MRLIILLVILRTCFGGVNDITPLKLQQEALLLREKHLLVYIVHLVALDQVDDVEVDLKLFLASVEENSLLLGEGVAPRAPAAEASAKVGANGDNPIRHRLGELFAVHNKLIEEVELLGLGLLADVEALPLVVLLDELPHSI